MSPFPSPQIYEGLITRIEVLMEYGGKSLDKIDVFGKLDCVHDMMYQLINILCLLTKIGISHFDIKPSNILWKSGRLILIDYETAVNFYKTPEEINEVIDNDKIIGYTENFAPKEFLEDEQTIPQKFDVYSFACTFYEIIIRTKNNSNKTITHPVFKDPIFEAILE